MSGEPDLTGRAWRRFGDDLLRRCVEVREHHGGIVPSSWPRAWQLATAFALRDHRHLDTLGATTPDVAQAVAAELGTDLDAAVLELDTAHRRVTAATGIPTRRPDASVCQLFVQVEVDHGRWVIEVGDDPDHLDASLSEDVADLVRLMLPSTTRLVLSWAEVTVRPSAATRVPCSPAHNVAAMLVEVIVAEALWRETGPEFAELAESVRADVATALGAISQFVDTDATIVTEIGSPNPLEGLTVGKDRMLSALPAPQDLSRDHAALGGAQYADVVRRAADLKVRAWADEANSADLARQIDPLWHAARDLLLAAGAERTWQGAQDRAGRAISQLALSRWRTDGPPPGGDRA